MNIEHISSQFKLKGRIQEIIPFGHGHINDTFRIINKNAVHPDYLLQKINDDVFKDVASMMDNILKVTSHIKSKLNEDNSPNFEFETLDLIKTVNDKLFYKDGEGKYWRVYEFFKDLYSYDVAETPEQVYEGARAFGKFFKLLSDFPAQELSYTIPNFHNVASRLSIMQSVIKNANEKKINETRSEVKYILEVADEMSSIEKLGEEGKIQLRVTHNDTKFNNVLLDKNNVGRCVIDLDTVMPGYVAYDFGDGIRTTVSTAAEDEPDLTKVSLDIDKLKAYSNGYLELTRDLLTPMEIQYLPLSGALLSYLMGLRFLTDYLADNVYYKIHFGTHNLIRSRCQLELTKKIMRRLPDIDKIIRKAANQY